MVEEAISREIAQAVDPAQDQDHTPTQAEVPQEAEADATEDQEIEEMIESIAEASAEPLNLVLQDQDPLIQDLPREIEEVRALVIADHLQEQEKASHLDL